MDSTSADARHAAYRQGLCVDCKTEPHSAGRPRCTTCHKNLIDRRSQGEIL